MSTSNTQKQYGMSKTASQRRNKPTSMKPPQTHTDKKMIKDAGETTKAVIAGMVNDEMAD